MNKMNTIINFMNIEEGADMKADAVRHKHLRLNQDKLDRLKLLLGARSETETLETAMDLLLAEEDIKTTLREVKGTGRIKRVLS